MHARPWTTRLTSLVLFGAVLVSVAAELSQWQPAHTLMGTWLMGAAAISALAADRFARWFSLVLTAVSLLLLGLLGVPWPAALDGAVSGGTVLVFLLLVEVLGGAIATGGYDKALTAMLTGSGRSGRAMRRIAWGAAFVLAAAGTFMAAVPAVYYALGAGAGHRRIAMAISATRGFAGALLINPISPLVVMAIEVSGAPLREYLRYALPVLAGMVVAEWWAAGRAADPGAGGATPAAGGLWRMRHTLAAAGCIAAFGAAYDALHAYGISTVMRTGLSVASAGLVLGLAAPRPWLRTLRRLPTERYMGHVAAAPLFVFGGLFGNVVVASGVLAPLVAAMRRGNSPGLEVLLILTLMVLLRWVGVAPVVGVLIIGPVLAGAVSLTPSLYALALVFGGVLAFLGSPLSGTNLFVAGATGLSPLQVITRYQGVYVLGGAAVFLGYVWGLLA